MPEQIVRGLKWSQKLKDTMLLQFRKNTNNVKVGDMFGFQDQLPTILRVLSLPF